ncbi:MAG: sulfotransferase [Phycisphaerales bacterium]
MSREEIPKDLTIERLQYEFGRGAFGRSLVYGLELLKKNPNSKDIHRMVGLSQLNLGQFEKARQHFAKVLKQKPGDPHATQGMAESYKFQGRFEEAHRVLDAYLSRTPGAVAGLAEKAEVYQVQGDEEAAKDFALRALGSDPSNLTALIALANVVRRREGERADVIDRLRSRVLDTGLSAPQQSVILFTLGQLLDAEGEYDDAFAAYREANDNKPATFHGEKLERDLEGTLANWTREAVEAIPKIEPRHGDLPVFIVGMPRSGTSLVEQIIGSHPEVYGAGELGLVKAHARLLQGNVDATFPILTHTGNMTKPNMERFARKFLTDLRKLDPKAARITDKMPDNSIRLNIVGTCLPAATIIHCLRNPVDTCLSCYFQSFGPGVRYATRLEAIGQYYCTYRRLMDLWHEILDIEIHDVRYEDLTADQESQSRRLIDAVGLAWDDACLRFYESGRATITASNQQVRQPMYRSSVARWKKYEKHLGPLIESLGEYAEES